MDYKHTVIEGIHVIMLEHPEFIKPANGAIFRGVLSEKFPDANGEFVITYRNADGIYRIETPNAVVGNGAILDTVPENDWNNYNWGDVRPQKEEIEEEIIDEEKASEEE